MNGAAANFVNIQTADDTQKANYLSVLLNSRTALVRARALLVGVMNSTGDPDVTSDVGVQIDDIDAEIIQIDRRLKAFLAGERQIIPPDPANVQRIEEIVRELNGLIAAEQQRQTIFDLALEGAEMAGGSLGGQ